MILIRDRKFSKNEKPADSKVIDKIVKEERLNLGKPNSEEMILDDLAKYDYQTGTKHTKFVDEEDALIQEDKDKIMFLLGFENYSRLQKSKLFSDKKKDKKSTVIKSSIAGSGVIGSIVGNKKLNKLLDSNKSNLNEAKEMIETHKGIIDSGKWLGNDNSRRIKEHIELSNKFPQHRQLQVNEIKELKLKNKKLGKDVAISIKELPKHIKVAEQSTKNINRINKLKKINKGVGIVATAALGKIAYDRLKKKNK